MRILHYALGFPPYRSGGLTKFCMDLMIHQAKEGHTVAMAWPGQMGFVYKRTSVRKRKDIGVDNVVIGNYEIINPLPISYDEGIADINAFTTDVDQTPYKGLLRDFQPDIVHVHTLMGLHKSLLLVAREENIRLVFTAHDFFPICPKVTMFRDGAICGSAHDCSVCDECNTTALSMRKIQILQSPIYRALKDSTVVQKLRKRHRDAYLDESIPTKSHGTVNSSDAYLRLRRYYGSLLQLMDIVHYNSSVTKAVYESFYNIPNSCVVSISHADIQDHRKMRNYSHDTIRIRYLGNIGGAKGFFCLRRHWINCGMNDKTFVWIFISSLQRCRRILKCTIGTCTKIWKEYLVKRTCWLRRAFGMRHLDIPFWRRSVTVFL